jgi:CelD/BcsL family acetyltransferase involved in cellulose biosynthesis
MPHVVELRSLEALEPYRLAWRNLWRKTRGAAPSQTVDWYSAFSLHGDVEPRALVVCDDDRAPLGIVPLVVRRDQHAGGELRTLAYPVLPETGFCGPVTAQPTLVMLEAMRFLAAADDWDAIDLAGIDAERHDHGRTASAFYHAELAVRFQPSGLRAVVELDGSWNDYFRGRDAKFVERLERASLEPARRGVVEHVRHRPAGAMHDDADPRWDLYGDAMMLSLGAWDADDDTTSLCTPGRIDLFRALHAAAAKSGTLDLNLLYVEGRPAAFSYNYVVDDVVTVAAIGCDPEYADTEADALLLRAMLQDSCRLGDREVDLGGRRPTTNPWATRLVDAYRARHTRRPPLARRILDWGRRRVGSAKADERA